MKTALNSLAFALVVLCSTLGLYVCFVWFVRPGLKHWLIRRKDPSFATVEDYLDIMHTLFGKRVNIYSTTINGIRSIQLECRCCKRKNRLTQGFVGAVCGS